MKHTLISIILIAFAIPCSAQWKNANFGGQVLAFGVHDTTILAAGISTGNPVPFVYRYIPPVSWVESDYGIDFSQGNITSFASLGSYLFAAPFGHRIYSTTNEGSHWSPINAASPFCSNGTYLFGMLYPSNGAYIIRSGDSGTTWDSLTTIAVNTFAVNGACILAGCSGGIWRSINSGTNWMNIATTVTGTMTVMGSLLFIVDNAALAESTDSGAQWTTIPVDSAGVSETVNTLATDGKNLFAGTQRGVLVSTDTGAHWKAQNDSLYNLFGAISPQVTQMIVFDTSLFIEVTYGTGTYYVFNRPISELTKPDSTASVVQAISASDSIEIYPNPTTGLVTISAGGISILGISVRNLLGEDVLDVANSYSSQLSIDLSKYPAGTYFLQVQTAQGPILKKLTLDK